ncbi:hypothetical protein HDU96_006109 [Phlyctochytrium bullatum]|nr:hypothetical protein HDU96_006109 [Phlyctochytrium bullatum]
MLVLPVLLALAAAANVNAVAVKCKRPHSTPLASVSAIKTATVAPNGPAYGISAPSRSSTADAPKTTSVPAAIVPGGGSYGVPDQSAVKPVASSSSSAVKASTTVIDTGYGVSKPSTASTKVPTLVDDSAYGAGKPTSAATTTQTVVDGPDYGAGKPTTSKASTPCSTSTLSSSQGGVSTSKIPEPTSALPTTSKIYTDGPATGTSVASSVSLTSTTISVPTLTTTTITAAPTSSSSSTSSTASTTTTSTFVPPGVTAVPVPPKGLGFEEFVPIPDVPALVDNFYTNQRDNPCFVSLDTNAGVRVTSSILKFWQPSSLIVDAGVNLAARGTCPAVVASNWTGIPGDATDGKPLIPELHEQNIGYCINATNARPDSLIPDVFFEDRRNKGYNLVDGMGPLATTWLAISKANTSIPRVPADANVTRYTDTGNSWGDKTNPDFAKLFDFLDKAGVNASTEPNKRYFKYARPFRWSAKVNMPDIIKPYISTTPATDGGIVSGHTAEAFRKSLALAYVVPERFQQMVARAFTSGHLRILAGMHSPFDVIGGRIHGSAFVTANLYVLDPVYRRSMRVLARDMLLAALGTTDTTALARIAVSGSPDTDAYANLAAVAQTIRHRATYNLSPTGPTNLPATVPKGAEVMLESRFPYLTPPQLRVVLKTTAFASGHPINDEPEGWGRLNLFAAAGGPARLDGDLDVTQDADHGDFSAADVWRNDLAGAGKLVKRGSGVLGLAGDNSFAGGVAVLGGKLEALSTTALGTGDVYVGNDAALVAKAPKEVVVGGSLAVVEGGSVVVEAGSKVVVKGAFVAGGALEVNVVGLQAGQVVTVIEAASVAGSFSEVFGGKVVYRPTGVDVVVAAVKI